MVTKYTAVAFLAGCTLSVANLLLAGVLECTTAVVCQGSAAPSGDCRADGVVAMALLEHVLSGNKLSGRRPFVLYEFRNSFAVNLMPEVFQPPSSLPVTLRPRFMSGAIFTPECLGNIVGNMYHLPATIELAEALCVPERSKQDAMIWQRPVPADFVGKTMGDLVADGALGVNSEPEDLLGMPLALYRLGKTSERRLDRYVVTNPKADVVLRATDEVIWLAPKLFRHTLAEDRDKNADACGSHPDPTVGASEDGPDNARIQCRVEASEFFPSKLMTQADSDDMMGLEEQQYCVGQLGWAARRDGSWCRCAIIETTSSEAIVVEFDGDGETRMIPKALQSRNFRT